MSRRLKSRPRANADRASRMFCVAAERLEDTPHPLALQARLLTARFGFAPGVAELIAGFAFSTGAR